MRKVIDVRWQARHFHVCHIHNISEFGGSSRGKETEHHIKGTPAGSKKETDEHKLAVCKTGSVCNLTT